VSPGTVKGYDSMRRHQVYRRNLSALTPAASFLTACHLLQLVAAYRNSEEPSALPEAVFRTGLVAA
jgi:hypothetical protein